MPRMTFLFVLVLSIVACGGGVTSTLIAKGKPTGEGPAHVDVINESGVTINSLFVAETAEVDRARKAGAAPGSSGDAALWGSDLLGQSGLAEGQSFNPGDLKQGRYDFLAVDRDGREQLIKGVRLKAGGRYALEIHDGGWQLGR